MHVVIVGFCVIDRPRKKRIYEYGSDDNTVTETKAKNISPYLIEGGDLTIRSRSRPIGDAPRIVFGSMPNDGGHLILDDDEKKELLAKEPRARRYIRPFPGATEFIHGVSRWCLWLVDATPQELRAMPEVMRLVRRVRKHRNASRRATTRELAKTPALFGEIRQPDREYLLVPSASAERRRYIPMAFMPARVIGSNLVLMIPEATVFHFGVLSSAMHMAWVKTVCGRLKSDYRYSNRLVYNNFPWPSDCTERQRDAVESAAKGVLDVRSEFPGSTFADLYDPLAMPAKLLRAHTTLDRSVDRCYRKAAFSFDRQRVEFLFALYEKLTAS